MTPALPHAPCTRGRLATAKAERETNRQRGGRRDLRPNSPPPPCPAHQTLGDVYVQDPQQDGAHSPEPVKYPCVVLAESRRALENRGPKFTLRTAGGGESNLKVKKKETLAFRGVSPSSSGNGPSLTLAEWCRCPEPGWAVCCPKISAVPLPSTTWLGAAD